MTIRPDSYASVGEVTAFTRHLLGGESAFNSTTTPTLTDVEKMIDRASGVLNVAVTKAGLQSPITNSTAKLACDDWVTARATEYVELTQPGAGHNESEGSRYYGFRNLHKSASAFVGEQRLGWVYLGVPEARKMSDGLAFTGMDAPARRADPGDTSLEQPRFTRQQFDNGEGEA
jgi:hypothetical protein